MSAECNIVRVNTGDSTFCQNKTVCSVLQVAIYVWIVMDIHIGVCKGDLPDKSSNEFR